MGDELSERVEALEQEARRLRRWVILLAAILAGCVTVAASDAPGRLILRSLTIVDAEGTVRIAADTIDDGTAYLIDSDRHGKVRIRTSTAPNGDATVFHRRTRQRPDRDRGVFESNWRG